MADLFYNRVRTAAVAGWWTVLIAVLWLTVGWLAWMWLLKAQPDWLLALWGGGDLTWPDVHRIVLWFMGAAKMVLLGWLLATIGLSIWARKLKQST